MAMTVENVRSESHEATFYDMEDAAAEFMGVCLALEQGRQSRATRYSVQSHPRPPPRPDRS